jgi:hypothetical protein
MQLYDEQDFIIFRSDRSNKKYYAILKDDQYEEKPKRVYFGAIKPTGEPYGQYRDRTQLGLYKQYDHRDIERKRLYITRHFNNIKSGFNAGWLSYIFMWR